MTANLSPVLANLSQEQKELVYNVREIYPALDTTDCVSLCKSCGWNRDIVNSRLFENSNSIGDSKWKEIDRSSRRKKKDGEKTISKKKKAFNRRQRRGKFDRKGRGKPKDRKGREKKRGDVVDPNAKAKHLIQRTNAVTNASATISWAAKARAPPRPIARQNPSPQRDPSSKSDLSRKENEVSNSSSEHIGPPPGIGHITTSSVWTNVHNHDEPEPEVNHAEQYPDFFDPSEQFSTQNHLVEPEKSKMYAGDNLSSFPDSQIYSSAKYQDTGVKAELTPSSFQIDHDRRSSASQYSRPIENIESTGVEIRFGAEGPDHQFNISSDYVPDSHQFQFGEISNTHPNNANNVQDSRSRPASTEIAAFSKHLSENSAAVGGAPNFHKGGLTMPPANMIFPNSSAQQDPRGGLSMLGSLVLPPEQEQLKTGGTAIYQFGVDFSEERKMESTEHHHPPSHIHPSFRGDPTQQVLQRPGGRMDYAERPPYQRAEVSHEMNRTVNVNRNGHDLNLPSHQVDSRFNSRLDTSNPNQHANFEDIGPSLMASGREHGRQPLTHQRLEPHFEERKSNHIDIDDSRNPNRINNIQPPVHMAPTRPFARPDNVRSVPAEVPEAPFFSESKRMEPSSRGFEDTQPAEFQPSHHTHYVPNQPQTFKPKPNTGFKEAGYVQSAKFLEGEKNGPSPTPPLDSQYNHGPTMVNANTEYKQQHHHVQPAYTNQITYYPAYTTPVQTYQPQTYAAAPRTVGYPYSTQVVSTNAVYPQYSQPVGVYPVRH